MFIPLYKKNDTRYCSNYTTISLVPHASKVLLQIILERIRAKVESELPDHIKISSRTASDRAEALGISETLSEPAGLREKVRTKNSHLLLCFVDFEKAFDRVSRRKLWTP